MNNINSLHIKEQRLRQERDRTIEDLNKTLNEGDKELRRVLSDFESIQCQKDNLLADNERLLIEISKMKDLIYILSEQNQRVIIYFTNHF